MMDVIYSDLIDYLALDREVYNVVLSNFGKVDLNNFFSEYWGDDDNGLPELMAVVDILDEKVSEINPNNKFLENVFRHIRNEFLLVESDWDRLAKHVVWAIMKGG